MIAVHGLRFGYGETRVFDGLELTIPENAILTAPSGSGKTTLLRLIAGLLTPEAGEITGVPERVSFLFQEDRLLPWASALKNVELVCPRARALEMLTALGLEEKADKRPPRLSGGERRRVALARALCADGSLLLLDEPFKGMDPALICRAAELIRARGIPYLAALHAPEEAAVLGGQLVRCDGLRRTSG